MRTDIPCACAGCGIVYADARDRIEDERFKDTVKSDEFPREFTGKPCRVCGIDGKRAYRLLVGPLHVPRKDPLW